MKNSNFKVLVAKMDALQEIDQGKLKGGIKAIGTTNSQVQGDANYLLCNGNGYCPKK